MPSKTTEEEVGQLLSSTDEEARWYREVMALDPVKATAILTDVLGDEHGTVLTKKMAVMILGLLGDPRGVEPLSQMLHAADPVLRAQAAKALGRFAEPGMGAVEALIRGLTDEVYFVRTACAKALGHVGISVAVPRLEEMSATDPLARNQDAARKAIESIQGTQTHRGRAPS